MLPLTSLVATLATFVAFHVSGSVAMKSQPEADNTVAIITAIQPVATVDLVVLFKQDSGVGEFGAVNAFLELPVTVTPTCDLPVPTKPPVSSDSNYQDPRNDPGPSQQHQNPFTEQLGNGQPAMMEDMIAEYNRQNPANQIPPYVFCTSLHATSRVYTRREIWLAIQAGVHDIGLDVRTDDRSLGAAWPRRLGFQRPINTGDAVGRVMEYPLGADELELPLTQPADEATLMMDRVTFLHDGTYMGVIRYTNATQWHDCYPHGWHTFQRGRNATRSLFQRGIGAIRSAWDRWLGYQHGGYERLDDEQTEPQLQQPQTQTQTQTQPQPQQQQRPQNGRNAHNNDPNCPPGWI
ncbi:hypothetical protein GL218_07898 [Daldinia childiae]|uniref:uncharacterized protein n=1 Tax=Daldinia childiae TaxID=326645 RepID=UPI0014483044|nr:uncharacterized protein GL218_07898 [Daldinia childiae]KAF3069670.1 hypothetical protein GL218_07898 [Daldinia childiae]